MRLPATIALLSLFALPALAQTQAAVSAQDTAVAKSDLAAYLAQPSHQAAVIAAAREQLRLAPASCNTATLHPTGTATVLEPVRFGNGVPYTGAWAERVEAPGCSPLRVLNVLVLAHAEAPPQLIPTMPGDTHTDPMNQKPALQYAQAIAARFAAGCKPPSGDGNKRQEQLAFVDTQFDGYTGLPSPEVTDGREARQWREIWTLSACGSLYDVHLLFMPNARGIGLAGENPIKRPG